MKPSDRIFVALDTTDLESALVLGRSLKGLIGGVKVGKEFFTALGPDGVRAVGALGLPVFLDLKFHDIPATVAGAVKAALPLKPFMLNVHASGGAAMMRAAVHAAGEAAGNNAGRPLVLAVTVLTSMGDDDLAAAGVPDTVAAQVLRLAKLARDSGLDGVVCSALEAEALRARLGTDFKLVVPGIRPEWAATDDQKRITTPSQAVAMGADYLVIGRPITGGADPADAARRIADELGG
ncbi:MAG: orotidine-5'-phosphate decarboxylase [Proteobacteria bacterium]|nr:orotidine-5'-phosphate decarboxylase [Pseudomonadota bacterium]